MVHLVLYADSNATILCGTHTGSSLGGLTPLSRCLGTLASCAGFLQL